MDSGHSRGDRRLDRGIPPGPWPEEGPDEDLGNAEPDDRNREPVRPASHRADSPIDTGEWLHRADDDRGDPAEFDVAEYRQRLFSGPGSELYGMGGGGFDAFARFDDSAGFDRSRGFDSSTGPSGSTGFGGFEGFKGVEGFEGFGEHTDESAAFAAFAERSLDDDPAPRERFVPSPVPRQASADPGTRAEPGGWAEPESPMESSGLVRPYFRTRGRTRPAYDLALEALVQTSERGRRLERVRVPEHRSICGLCLDTRSVAEVAALLRLPLGVVRVLVGDVAGLGLVLVHSADSMVGDRPSIEFMERVLSGLRRL